MRAIKLVTYYLLGLMGIILVSVAPSAMRAEGMFRVIPFLQEFNQFIQSLFEKETWIYQFESYREPILTFLWDPFIYSMKIFSGAILVGLLVAFVLAIITLFLPKPIVAVMQRVMNLLEAVPDLMFAFMIQLLIVYIYKQTGVKVMEFTSFNKDIVALPMFVLAILPTISFYKIVLMYFEEEQRESYVEFAKSKGVLYTGIIFKHIIRNLAPNVFYHSKIIVWSTLSSLFVIEWIFNIQGIMYYIYEGFRPLVIAVALTYIFTPFFLLFSIGEMFTLRNTEDSEAISFKMRKGKSSAYKNRVTVKQWLVKFIKGMGPYFKNPKFLIGFLFLFGFVLISFYQSWFVEEPVSQLRYMYDEDGELVGAPPHPPNDEQILGSDRLGFDMLDQIIMGAKYTIIFATLIALLRVLLGLGFAIPYAFLLKGKRKRIVEKIVDSMHFVPLTVIAYLLLHPVLWKGPNGWGYTEVERIGYQILLLTILVVPLITVLLGNEIKMLFQREYMLSARTLGGDWKHMVKTHIMPHLAPRLGVVFGQQFIQVLLIFVHLGLFQLFFGGTDVSYGLITDPPRTSTYEWSGMISNMKNELMTSKYWMIYPIFTAFILSIVAMQLMLQGMREVQQFRIGVGIPKVKKSKKQDNQQSAELPAMNQENFTFVNGENKSQHL